jgi:hypothetical protein
MAQPQIPKKIPLKTFVGKVCTVFTVPINRNFKDENPGTFTEQVTNYFTGRVLEADSEGVVLEQITPERLRTFFFREHIVAIAEEEVLNPQDPREAARIQQIKQQSVSRSELQERAKQEVDDAQTQARQFNQNTDIPVSGQFMDVDAMNAFSESMSQKP